MSSTYQAAIDALSAIIRAVSGVRVVPDDPPDNINIYPFAVVYDGGGQDIFDAPGSRRSLDSLIVEVHFSRKDLQKAIQQAMPLRDTIANAIMDDPTITSTVDTFESLSRTFGPLAWGDPAVQNVGYRFTLNNVKRRTVIP